MREGHFWPKETREPVQPPIVLTFLKVWVLTTKATPSRSEQEHHAKLVTHTDVGRSEVDRYQNFRGQTRLLDVRFLLGPFPALLLLLAHAACGEC
jgi:hypothetical protein